MVRHPPGDVLTLGWGICPLCAAMDEQTETNRSIWLRPLVSAAAEPSFFSQNHVTHRQLSCGH